MRCPYCLLCVQDLALTLIDFADEANRQYVKNREDLSSETDDALILRIVQSDFALDSFAGVRDAAAGAFFVVANNILQTLAKRVNEPLGPNLKAGRLLREGRVTFTELVYASAANFRHHSEWPSEKGKSSIGILKRFGVPEDMMSKNVCGLVVETLNPLNAMTFDLLLHEAVNEISENALSHVK